MQIILKKILKNNYLWKFSKNDLLSQIDERIELFNLMLVKVKELDEILNYKKK